MDLRLMLSRRRKTYQKLAFVLKTNKKTRLWVKQSYKEKYEKRGKDVEQSCQTCESKQNAKKYFENID